VYLLGVALVLGRLEDLPDGGKPPGAGAGAAGLLAHVCVHVSVYASFLWQLVPLMDYGDE